MDWIDVSVPLRPEMAVWPGDPAVRVEQVLWLDRGDLCNLTRLALGAHTGTHIDAPRHFVATGGAVETMPLDMFFGPARVVDTGEVDRIGAAEVPADLAPGERVLFRTRNSRRRLLRQDTFAEDYVWVTEEAARALVRAQVRSVGIDYLSVGGFAQETAEPHQVLLGAGVWLLEGLDLVDIEPGRYELACLPLLIAGADGAPARAFLRRLGS